mgnify:CR=1 FL=1
MRAALAFFKASAARSISSARARAKEQIRESLTASATAFPKNRLASNGNMPLKATNGNKIAWRCLPMCLPMKSKTTQVNAEANGVWECLIQGL